MPIQKRDEAQGPDPVGLCLEMSLHGSLTRKKVVFLTKHDQLTFSMTPCFSFVRPLQSLAKSLGFWRVNCHGICARNPEENEAVY
ncbi:hypothetical protein TNCV_4370381 [Trichonephila clavipes]|uniref:Uncharacterized protein n=1 Tax=Trichonephila clavipes TaxID=2585209 RepID=A0A8X6VF21_TRICX|nr:hypothetical protein TNCV_4370381 [Trichonephila clavipes]